MVPPSGETRLLPETASAAAGGDGDDDLTTVVVDGEAVPFDALGPIVMTPDGALGHLPDW